ncbi:MAG TPA: heavy metal-binding domain-containing protein [Acidimicrobiales bacterium]|nr:heavy metal-binding domain-containing protein [Acidimicrobiales bacterium]
MKTPDEWTARRQEIRDAVRDIYGSPDRKSAHKGRPVTSDLSIDEALVLHSIGWEPVELVCGAGVYPIPTGAWQWAYGEIRYASVAMRSAFDRAAERIGTECAGADAAGVVGVRVDVTIERHAVYVVLVGTAVAPSTGRVGLGRPFVSDLSGQDFALLHNAGWEPCGLAHGAAFVYAPRRSAADAISQTRQNVELTNFTEAIYAARESAMARAQSSALGLGANGIVAVQVSEGPMDFAHHAIGFVVYGTAVKPGPAGHQYRAPQVSVSLDDRVRQFDVTSLRGTSTG